MKTIKQIADEVGTTKQAMQKRLSREPLKTSIPPHVSTDKGTKYIDDAGVELIKAAYETTDKPIDTPTDKPVDKGIDTSTDTVQTLISMLQKELDIKNKQIEDLTSALEHTTASLHAAQALHAGTMQKHLTDGKPVDDAQDEKPGLWSRIFGRKKDGQ